MLHANDPRLDDLARHELTAETAKHRDALGGQTDRQWEEAVAEAHRHLDRVHEIMENLMARATVRG